MIAHGAAVVRSTEQALVVVDLPFGSYQASPVEAGRARARGFGKRNTMQRAIERSEISNLSLKIAITACYQTTMIWFIFDLGIGDICRVGCCIFWGSQPALGLGRGNPLLLPCRTSWQGKCCPCPPRR